MEKLCLYIEEVNEKTTQNNQYGVLTSSQGGIVPQEDYFNKQVASTDNTGYKVIRKGQFTYRSMSDTGRFYINRLTNREVGIVSPAYPVFKITSDKIIPEYLSLFFQSEYFQSQISNKASGSTRLALRYSKLKNVEIDIATKKKQEEIIENIDFIKKVIEAEEREQSILDELIKSRFNEMFGDVDSNTHAYPSFKIGTQFSLGAGGTPSTQNKEYWDKGTISWIGSNMCQNVILYENDGKYITEKGYTNSSAKLFYPDTVLVALVGATIGKVALLKFETTTNQNVLGMWDIKKNGYNPYYVYYYMQAIYGKFKAIGDGNFKMASKSFVSNLDILKPSLEKQNEFASFVNQIDKLKFNVQQRIEKYKELLNKKMSEYFN